MPEERLHFAIWVANKKGNRGGKKTKREDDWHTQLGVFAEGPSHPMCATCFTSVGNPICISSSFSSAIFYFFSPVFNHVLQIAETSFLEQESDADAYVIAFELGVMDMKEIYTICKVAILSTFSWKPYRV